MGHKVTAPWSVTGALLSEASRYLVPLTPEHLGISVQVLNPARSRAEMGTGDPLLGKALTSLPHHAGTYYAFWFLFFSALGLTL